MEQKKKKVGRPPKPGEVLHIPKELIALVKAMKAGDRVVAVQLFAEWMALPASPKKDVDNPNKAKLN